MMYRWTRHPELAAIRGHWFPFKLGAVLCLAQGFVAALAIQGKGARLLCRSSAIVWVPALDTDF